MTGLASNRHYSVRLLARDLGELATGAFDTLPAELPDEPLGTIASGGDAFGTLASDESVNRELTLFLGSCYWAADDHFNTVADRYERVYRSLRHRPHIKFLVGDQVYLDQHPIRDWGKRKTTRELRSFLTGRYHSHWVRLRGLLSRGGTICIADDHEFWNDYPYAPVVAWASLQRPSYRKAVAREAGALFDAVQLGRATTRIDIGTDLSILVADTRVNRAANNKTFMRPEDLDSLEEWIDGLQAPGVLVIGQPIFQGAYGHATGYDYVLKTTGFKSPISNVRTDHNLAAFEQYMLLTRALTSSNHDILILSGDVHFGRVATVRIDRDGGDPVRIWEVISSPMTVLNSSPGFPEVTPTYWPVDPALPKVLAQTYLAAGARGPGRVRYERFVSLTPGTENVGCRDHFMTLQFSKLVGGRGVRVSVHAWLLLFSDDQLPVRDWTYTFELDAGRLPSTREDRVVTHVFRDDRRRTLGLANLTAPWSPRWVDAAIADIENNRVRYIVDSFGEPAREIVVVHRQDGAYLRSGPDETPHNNLDNLPDAPPEHMFD